MLADAIGRCAEAKGHSRPDAQENIIRFTRRGRKSAVRKPDSLRCGSATLSGVPVTFEIHPELRLLFIRGQGVVTQVERLRAMLAWLHDPDYECCEDALFDVTAAKSTPRVAEMRELITILQQMPRKGPRRLAIVTSKPIAFGVAHVFAKLLRVSGIPLQVRVFMDVQSAWRWLRPDLLSSVSRR